MEAWIDRQSDPGDYTALGPSELEVELERAKAIRDGYYAKPKKRASSESQRRVAVLESVIATTRDRFAELKTQKRLRDGDT